VVRFEAGAQDPVSLAWVEIVQARQPEVIHWQVLCLVACISVKMRGGRWCAS
jgi:hypothetical protein